MGLIHSDVTVTSPWVLTCLSELLPCVVTGSCDRNRLNKIVRCSNNDDSVTIRASDSSDHVTLLFESPSKYCDVMIIDNILL